MKILIRIEPDASTDTVIAFDMPADDRATMPIFPVVLSLMKYVNYLLKRCDKRIHTLHPLLSSYAPDKQDTIVRHFHQTVTLADINPDPAAPIPSLKIVKS